MEGITDTSLQTANEESLSTDFFAEFTYFKNKLLGGSRGIYMIFIL